VKTAAKIIFIVMFVLGNVIAADDLRADDAKPDCARVQKLLDQYAHILFLNSSKKDDQALEVQEKELVGQFKQLNLPSDLMTKTQSLLKSIRQCYGFAGSAAFGMKGFFTDLHFRMEQDAGLREKCANIENQYKKLLQECGVDEVK
jgi:hypothetical protein